MLAHELMITPPEGASIGTPVSEIIRIMLLKNISAVMVTAADGSLVGLVSEGDLLRRRGSGYLQRLNHYWLELLAEGEPMNLEFLHSLQLSEMTAVSVMTSPVITCDEWVSFAEIADTMLKHSIKQIPITREGKLVGIISRRNILRTLIEQEV
jgi:CBS domain-containing protein